MTANNQYHIPVLLSQSVDGLITDLSGVYVDVTFGGGGHSSYLLSKLSADGVLVAFDQDEDVKANLIDDKRFEFVPQNFAYVKNNLRLLGYREVDGLLADLGVSSHQFDVPERGFSFRFSGDLDMRMSQESDLTAAKIVNGYEESQLRSLFGLYGELKNAFAVASRIVYKRRQGVVFKTTSDLIDQIRDLAPRGKENTFFAKVFQALRIEVNDEMGVLKELLNQCGQIIKTGGRISFITYHSIEDRMVKNYIKTGNVEGELKKDFFGNVERPFKEVNRKPIVADEAEIERNNRARSAKLRIAEKK